MSQQIDHERFGYRLSIEHNYIIAELWGRLDEAGIAQATNDLILLAEKNNTRRVLYDASRLIQTNPELRKKSIGYFKMVSLRMEKLASYVPDPKIYMLAKFMSLLSGIKNWKPFVQKEKAIKWLME